MKVELITGVTNAIVKITWRYTGLNRVEPSSTCYIVEIPELEPSFEVSRCKTYTLWKKCRENIVCSRAKKEFIRTEERLGLNSKTIVSIEVVD